MSKILVNDLKELAKQSPQTIAVPFHEFLIEVKTYLPITEKINLVSSIYKSAVDEDDSLSIINYNALHIAYKVLVTKAYSDVSLPKDTVQAYNMLVSTGLYDKIYESIPLGERLELEKVFDNYIDEKEIRYERENTLPNIVKNILNGLVDKLPSMDEAKMFIEQASKEIEGFSPDKLQFIQDFMKINKGENIG
jgi:hypothetical protein